MSDEPSRPFVSVIVPMRNERRHIQRCLRSLAAQDYPRDRFEVIVVDGGSGDGSRELAEAMREELANLRVMENRGRNTARGLNIGLAFARGEVIVRVDAHASVARDFLGQGVAALRRANADVVGGPIRTLGEGPAGEAVALAVSSPFGVGNAVFRYSEREQWTDTVAFPAYRRDVFDRVGPFAEIDGGEDDEFHYRLRDAGGRILLTPQIRSTYYARRSYWELARQYFGYGQAKVVVLSRHPRQTRLRQIVPSAFVVALLASTIVAFFGGLLVVPLAALVGAYLTASLAASAVVSRRHGWRHLFRLPLAFACMHLAYGLGLITGLVRRTFGQQVATPQEAEAP
ncbi:MAG: glycosyltransferase family 2 protein [Dehalococcoidia bacterium]|nr:glycosyltransferase family 2 protein [Dehalococcoidia bacterium]